MEDLRTKTVPKGYSSWGDKDGIYITEVYTDGYPWANPFVGLSDYYEQEITSVSGKPIRVALAQTVSVTPGDKPLDTWVQCDSAAYATQGEDGSSEQEEGSGSEYYSHFLWGFHDLIKAGAENVPSRPDTVDAAINAKRLAAFAVNGGVTVEYVADDAALQALKKQYGDPVALISGDYESKNGTEFTFTGGAAMLSPSVTATWNKSSGKLVIKKDGTIEHSGVSLNAPSFKFYQPKNGAENDLQISLTKDGFAFQINPDKNDAIVFVDIPYAAVKLKNAKADAAGNLVFSGNIGFRTIFNGAKFSMEKLGYGLNTKHEFKVNGVKATGSFDTAKLMALDLTSISGEVNTFKGEESYAFELELNAFDLFETEASLALVRSKKDGSLIPDDLWFYVKSSPGIPLVPPVPVGQLNGGGAGFKDLAKTVNGDYFAIPPIKLRGALTGTYMHLIEGTGNVVLGPSEISLKATDVGIVGLGKNAQIIDSFGYSLQLNGQERTYNGVTYKGIYFGGSEELALNLPSNTLDIFTIDTAINGMVVNEAAARRNHVGRVTDSEENFSVYSQATLDAEDKAFVMKIQDTVRAAVEEARFSQVVSKMQEAKTAQMNTHDIPAVVKLASKEFHITDNESTGVLQRLIESNDLTLYGLSNAVTRHSQDVESYDRASELESIGYSTSSAFPMMTEKPSSGWPSTRNGLSILKATSGIGNLCDPPGKIQYN